MAGKVTVVKNFIPNVIQNLTAVVPQTTRERLERVRDRAKELAPVKTGFLRDSIEVVMTGVSNGSVVAQKEYAPYVELGTSRAPAQPFLLPALEEEKGNLPDAILHAIIDGLPR
jgi:HK97 gp10 family phage protein